MTELTYGLADQPIPISLASLANDAARQSTKIDNSVNRFVDALVLVKLRTGASGVSANGYVTVYAYGSADGGTTFTDGVTGVDGAFTPTNPHNLKRLGVVHAYQNGTSFIGGPFSVAEAFGGTLPQWWGIVLENRTGAALDPTAGNFDVHYQGVK